MNRAVELLRRSRPLTIGGAIVVALLVAMLASPGRVPFGIALQGALYGTTTGLLGIGLVLTYRSDRIVNFSYGAMGGVGASVGVLLYLGKHWNYLICIFIGLAVGGLVGAGTEMFVIRRFARAPRLILTVATIGLAQVLGGIQLLLPKWLSAPALVGGFKTPLSGPHLNVGPVLFTGDALLVVAVVPVAILLLAYFLLRTDAGVAIRAIADNRDRAMLVGVPIRRLATVVWIVAGVLAALTTLLSAPTAGLTINAAAGPTLLLPALAAAVIAGMESLPIAFVAGTGLGVLDAVVRWNFTKQSVSTVAFLIVILLALLGQRESGRRENAEDSSLSTAAAAVTQIPSALRRLPEVVAGRVIGLTLLGILVIAVPAAASESTVRIFSVGVIYAIVAVSLVVLSGWAGEISLGQYALVGIGGVVAGNMITHWNVDFFVCLVCAATAGAVLAVLVGLPALRIRGLFLAVTTLALAVAADAFFFNPTNFASLIPSSIDRPILWKRFDLTNERALYYLCLAMLVLTIVVVRGLRQARAGRVMLATRDNPRAAAAMAVPTTRIKLLCFVISGAIAGMAGGLHALILQSIGFGTYQPSESLLVFSMVVIGGLGSIGGALLGVLAIECAVHLFPQYQLVITGTGLLLVLLLLPGGLASALTALRDRLLTLVARRHGIDLTPTAAGATDVDAAVEPVSVEHLADSDTLFHCRGVEVKYGAMQVLFGADLEVREGEIVALLGTNGAGKSTLLKAIAGLVPPSGGRVVFAGQDVTSASTQRKATTGLAMMPAKSVFPSLTVDENLRIAAWLVRGDAAAAEAARDEVRDLFPVLRERRGQVAGNLSGGEQQMLSLAMALMTRPRLLLIDELSLGLAPTIVGRLLGVVRQLVERGVTVVIVEQSVNVALELAERAVFLEKGQVRFSGRTADLLARPDVLRSVFIAGAATVEQPKKPARGRGRARTAPAQRTALEIAQTEPQPIVLECQSVVKDFGGVRALDHVDLALHKHEILGLIGHNGAGKTTLFDVICGFLPSDRGRVLFGGAPMDAFPPSDRAFLGLGRSFQEARLYPSLTVEETIAVAFERHLFSRDVVAAGLRLPASTLSEMAVAQRVGELIEQLGLGRYAESLVGQLSTGTRRIVELGCVLAQDPAVLLLDEPTGGVAQKETEALGPLLRQVREETGCAMLVIEHDMPLLTSLCDRLVALELGQVIAEGAPAAVLEHPRVIESYLGTDAAATNRSGALANT
ncbi:MAG TPA: ATP-binding cassette domain-containing protein [Mycobacteriales bacterium]|nr:ATP-binding cassette domain-containing protein [Mycobacteriales bacterium]